MIHARKQSYIDDFEVEGECVTRRLTLVVNRNYQPIGTITLKRALNKLFKETAMIIVPPDDSNGAWQEFNWSDWSLLQPQEGESVLRAVEAVFKVPEIIKCKDFSDVPHRHVKFSRRAIYKRDNFTCQYCGKKAPEDISYNDLSIDHIMPQSRGGKSTWENVAIACYTCNHRKANRTPDEANMKLRSQPRMPNFDVLQGRTVKVDSWQAFLGEMYWRVALDQS